ncbi:MAG: hypothetical protein NT109_01985 [Flavobacteriia bacterium]|nr:hypothetical protein [Flavobacteriia bacterium]
MNKSILFRYIRNSSLSFLVIVLIYSLISASISIETFPSKVYFLALMVLSILFFSGWIIMLPAIFRNPKELLIGIISLTVLQMLIFMTFSVAVIFYNAPTNLIVHVMLGFLALIVAQTICIKGVLKG